MQRFITVSFIMHDLWDLKSFLIKPNGIYKFIPEGHIWKSYLNMQKEKVKEKVSEYID